jgi:hypothetical protein
MVRPRCSAYSRSSRSPGCCQSRAPGFKRMTSSSLDYELQTPDWFQISAGGMGVSWETPPGGRFRGQRSEVSMLSTYPMGVPQACEPR